jgi:hypothetical protein
MVRHAAGSVVLLFNQGCKMSRLLSSCMVTWLLPLLGGCSFFGGGVPAVKVGEVRVQAMPDANRNSPIVLGVVLIADAELEKRVLSPDLHWFDSDADLAATYPLALHAYRCELSPGQEMQLPASLFKGQRARSVVLLAAMGGAERRARIDSWRDGGVVAIGRDNWQVTQNSKPAQKTLRLKEMQCKTSGQAS